MSDNGQILASSHGDALLSCPFCRGEAFIGPVARDWWRLRAEHADDCLLHDQTFDAPQTDEGKRSLIADWNRRPEGAGASATQARAAFYAGWKVNAAPADDGLSQHYLDACMEADWREHCRMQALASDPSENVSPALVATLMELYRQVKAANEEASTDLTPVFACEVDIVTRLLAGDLLIPPARLGAAFLGQSHPEAPQPVVGSDVAAAPAIWDTGDGDLDLVLNLSGPDRDATLARAKSVVRLRCRLADNANLSQASISAYALPNGIRVESTSPSDAKCQWAARWWGDCLSTAGTWDWEPQPSSRTAEWLSTHRFPTAAAAIAAAQAEQHPGPGQ